MAPAYACPGCGFLVCGEPPGGTFAICPVCRWEDCTFNSTTRTMTAAPTESAWRITKITCFSTYRYQCESTPDTDVIRIGGR